MKDIKQSSQFRRDLKKIKKRGKDLSKLYRVVEALALDHPLDRKHVPHPLTGDWKPCWDCHIEPDWLLIYIVTEQFVELVRTGSHADLFR